MAPNKYHPREDGADGWWSERLNRRNFIVRALAASAGSGIALSLLSGCGTGSSAADISFWNLFSGGDGERLTQMQDAFRKDNPGVGLESVTLQWGIPYYTKLAMASTGGRPPEVAILHMSRLSTYAAGGALDHFDLKQLSDFGISESNFVAPVWKKAQYNNALYAAPLDTHPLVLYYNQDLCQKAGLLDGSGNLKPIQGADALMKAFKAGKQASGSMGVVFEATGVMLWRMFITFYSQLSGTLFNEDASKSTLDDAKALKVIQFLSDMTVKEKVAPSTTDYAGSVADFGSGKSTFHINGEWEVTTFQSQKMKFNMVPLPTAYDNKATWADSHCFVLPHQAYPNVESRKAALRFVSYMLKTSQTWAQGGHIPAYLPVTESSGFKSLKPQANYASVANEVVYDPPAWFSGAASDLETQVTNAIQGAVSGSMSPDQALEQMKKAMNKLLTTPAPVTIKA